MTIEISEADERKYKRLHHGCWDIEEINYGYSEKCS